MCSTSIWPSARATSRIVCTPGPVEPSERSIVRRAAGLQLADVEFEFAAGAMR
jgi:hypothetical protein